MSMGDETCGVDTKECANPDSLAEVTAKEISEFFVKSLLEDTIFEGRQYIEVSDDGEIEVFATENISVDEILATLSYHDMIVPDKEEQLHLGTLFCTTMELFLTHVDMKEKSDYSDYVNFILSNIKTKTQPLESWPKNSLKLFGKLIGVNLPPYQVADAFHQRFEHESWIDECDEHVNADNIMLPDDITLHEIMLAVAARTLDLGYMVPLLDCYSHRSGEWANIQLTFDDDNEVLIVRSIRDIDAGEKLYYSYQNVRQENDPFIQADGGTVVMDTPAILTEYGFLEDFPRVFTFAQSIEVTLDKDEDGNITTYVKRFNSGSDSYQLVSFLKEEIYRLGQSTKQFDTWISSGNYTSMSDAELTLMKNYASSLDIALSEALEATTEVNLDRNDGVYVRDEDESYWINMIVCGNEAQDKYMNFDGYYIEHESAHKSKYQNIAFYEKPETHDKCLELETTVQICANYRPYYHEPFVHFPATLLPSPPKRVVFVGGGDAMLLHEVLKYPSIEKVIGLELDQVVVRQSFKHFHTQPHFDDPRVEWWFGDATKTLNVLPKEYFGSFDLVLIDLSETVMSFTVTKNLNVIEALALLAKPDGIVVKNEHYFHEFTQIFDHTVEVTLRENPVICDQHFAMGSNRINFMKPNFKHVEGIETLLYHPLKNVTDHVDIIKRYSRNNAITQNKCGKTDDDDDLVKAGILLVVDAEDTNAATDTVEELTKKVENAVGKEGLTILSTISTPSEDGVMIVVVTKEAFVSVRTWPNHNYCAIDLHFWGAFDKQLMVQKSLEQGLEANKVSTYRVVVGGMIGTSTWDTDKTTIGPVITNTRDCTETPSHSLHESFDINALVEETIVLIKDKKGIITVICADETQCGLLNSFEKIGKKVFLIIAGDEMESELKETSDKHGPIISMFIDSKIDSIYVKRLSDIAGRKENQRTMFGSSVMLVLPDLDLHRFHFMDQLRVRTLSFQTQSVVVTFGGRVIKKEVGFVFFGDSNLLINLSNVCEKLEARMGLSSNIDKMNGMVTKPMIPFEPHNYNLEDYDSAPALDQFSRQIPLGSQSIFQLVYSSETKELDASSLYDAVGFSVRRMFEMKVIEIIEEISDGVLIIALFEEGHVILSWGGAERVDINIFTFNEDINHEGSIIESIKKIIPDLSVILLDEQPRGVERVVNFSKHLDEKRTPGCWDMYDMCKVFASENKCSEGDHQEFMHLYCHKSCGICQ